MGVSGTVSAACYSLVSHNFCRFCRSECLDSFSTRAVDRDTLESSFPHHVSLFQAEKALCMFPRHYTVTTSFCRELMGKLGFDAGRVTSHDPLPQLVRGRGTALKADPGEPHGPPFGIRKFEAYIAQSCVVP